ncbi:hypothetical protein [Halomarina litorea]|uniref:hypothetical protein n=1 Tax=Halomarina litorea TaxID=2961595 RepID=UPI0020C4F0FF|nr:hypothetical protein [Halomarina sp. BCD28]
MNDEAVRRLLLSYSDSQPCRIVWEAAQGGELASVDARTLVEALRATRGSLCLVVQDGAADVFLRAAGGGFDRISVWPPSGVVDFESGLTREDACTLVESNESPRLLATANSPFARDEDHTGPGDPWP